MFSLVEPTYFKTCCTHFLQPLIEIIRPMVVITLGTIAYRSIATKYNLKAQSFRNAVECEDGFPLGEYTRLFPVYHCGINGWNVSRTEAEDRQDWTKIGRYLKSI